MAVLAKTHHNHFHRKTLWEKFKHLMRALIFWDNSTTSIPEVPWSLSDGIKMILLTFLLLTGGGIGVLYICIYFFGAQAVYDVFHTHLTWLVFGLLCLQVAIEMLLLYWYTYRKYHVTLDHFGFRQTPVWQTLILAIFMFVFVESGQQLIIFFMNTVGVTKLGEQKDLYNIILGTKDSLWWFWLIFASIIAPVTEEIIYRAVLLPSALKKFGYKFSIAITAAIFAFAHISFNVSSWHQFWLSIMDFIGFNFPFLFILGAILNVLYLHTNSLWPGIIFHSVNNTVITFLLLHMNYGVN